MSGTVAHVWIVGVRYQDVTVARHRLVKKTPKMYVVSAGPATGHGTHIHLDDKTVRVFETEAEARVFASEKLRVFASRCEEIARRLRVKAEGIAEGLSDEQIDDRIRDAAYGTRET